LTVIILIHRFVVVAISPRSSLRVDSAGRPSARSMVMSASGTSDASASGAAEVEMDTAESEEDSCTWSLIQSSLLPPDGRLPCGADGAPPPRFGLHVSGAVFGGWVKQSSPACAAASVAGAWNALAGGGRRGPLALRQDDVLRHMRDALAETIAGKRARFERLLGAPIADFEEALDRAFEDAGKTLGGESKAVPGLKRAEAMRLAIALAKSRGDPELDAEADAASATTTDVRDTDDEENPKGSPSVGENENPPPRTSFAAIAALIREDEADKEDEAENEGDQGVEGDQGIEGDEGSEAEEPDDDDDGGGDGRGVPADASGKENDAGKTAEGDTNGDDDANLLAALAAGVDVNGGKSGRKKRRGKPPARLVARLGGDAIAAFASTDDAGGASSERKICVGRRWTWRKDFWEILKKRAGLEKLDRAKPSTAAFGNAGVAEATRRCAAAAAASSPSAPRVHARVVAGVKTKTRANLLIPIERRGDQTAAAAREWASLRELFSRDDVALVSHHKNHYALVFALRERCDADEGRPGGVRWTREMLTARRGQRPSAWISWEEARATMLGWSGYGILAVTVDRDGER
jgi:hypothetical protein